MTRSALVAVFSLLLFGLSANADSSLLMHLTFDDDFAAQGYVFDASGNNNHAWRFKPTKWIVPTNGAWGSRGALFYTNYFTTNGPTWYEASQYLGVINTNSALFGRLTNGTVSFWADFYEPKYPQGLTFLFDGFCKNQTNTFRVGILRYTDRKRIDFRAWKSGTTDSDGDRMCMSLSPHPPGLSHYAVTWNATSNTTSIFTNGIVAGNGTMLGLPWLNIATNPTWLCIGANRNNNGTPEFGDDKFPNDCFHQGVLDEVSIYNRTLSKAEVRDLYSGAPQPPTALAVKPLGQ